MLFEWGNFYVAFSCYLNHNIAGALLFMKVTLVHVTFNRTTFAQQPIILNSSAVSLHHMCCFVFKVRNKETLQRMSWTCAAVLLFEGMCYCLKMMLLCTGHQQITYACISEWYKYEYKWYKYEYMYSILSVLFGKKEETLTLATFAMVFLLL